MSYARFSEDCDVYVFADPDAHSLRCLGCAADLRSTDAMVEHLRDHIARGDAVPEAVIPALEADRHTNGSWLAGAARR